VYPEGRITANKRRELAAESKNQEGHQGSNVKVRGWEKTQRKGVAVILQQDEGGWVFVQGGMDTHKNERVG